jgi:hypothetical protein
VKKYFSSKMPRLVAMYLLAVTPRHRRLVHADRIRHRLEIQRARNLHAVGKGTRPAGARFGRYLEDRLGALIERAISQVAVCRQSAR